MKKAMTHLLLVITAITSASNAMAWDQSIIITDAARKSGGTLTVGELPFMSLTFNKKTYNLADPKVLHKHSVGIECISGYEFQTTGNKISDEFIKFYVPAGENWCTSRTLVFGTLEELQDKKPGTIYWGNSKDPNRKPGKFAVWERRDY